MAPKSIMLQRTTAVSCHPRSKSDLSRCDKPASPRLKCVPHPSNVMYDAASQPPSPPSFPKVPSQTVKESGGMRVIPVRPGSGVHARVQPRHCPMQLWLCLDPDLGLTRASWFLLLLLPFGTRLGLVLPWSSTPDSAKFRFSGKGRTLPRYRVVSA